MAPKHNFRFVWQRAEENPLTQSGGHKLVEEGVCAEISKAYGLHIWATGQPGVFLSRSGGFLANSDRLKIVVHCTGGHVAFPNHGSNAVDIGIDICQGLKGFDTRYLGPSEPCSLVPAIFQSGTGSNIRPSQAEIWFAVRNVLPLEARQQFHLALKRVVDHVVAGYPDATVQVKSIFGHPALINTPESFNEVSGLLRNAGESVEVHEQIMGGEDFAHYLNAVPGSFWLLGAYQEGCGDHHTPTFNPDESVFWKGVLFWLILATN